MACWGWGFAGANGWMVRVGVHADLAYIGNVDTVSNETQTSSLSCAETH